MVGYPRMIHRFRSKFRFEHLKILLFFWKFEKNTFFQTKFESRKLERESGNDDSSSSRWVIEGEIFSDNQPQFGISIISNEQTNEMRVFYERNIVLNLQRLLQQFHYTATVFLLPVNRLFDFRLLNFRFPELNILTNQHAVLNPKGWYIRLVIQGCGTFLSRLRPVPIRDQSGLRPVQLYDFWRFYETGQIRKYPVP